MSFSVRTTASIVKTVASVSQIVYAVDKTVSSGEEVIKTFLVSPQTATEYVKVNLDPFTLNPNITNLYFSRIPGDIDNATVQISLW